MLKPVLITFPNFEALDAWLKEPEQVANPPQRIYKRSASALKELTDEAIEALKNRPGTLVNQEFRMKPPVNDDILPLVDTYKKSLDDSDDVT